MSRITFTWVGLGRRWCYLPRQASLEEKQTGPREGRFEGAFGQTSALYYLAKIEYIDDSKKIK